MRQKRRDSRRGSKQNSSADAKSIRAAFIINMFREFPDREFSLKQLTSASGGNSQQARYIVREVVEGLDVVEKIQQVATGSADRPKEDVVMTMTVLE